MFSLCSSHTLNVEICRTICLHIVCDMCTHHDRSETHDGLRPYLQSKQRWFGRDDLQTESAWSPGIQHPYML